MHHPSFQGCGIQDELGWLVLSNWKVPQQVPQWSFQDKLKWLRREFLENPDVCSTQGQAFGVGVRGHHGFDMGTHLSEAAVYSSRSHGLFRFVHGRMEEIVSAAKEHMVAMSQRAPPGHETKRQMECL